MGRYGGQCVVFARNFTHATPKDVSGIAKNVPTNSEIPQIGAIVKTNESKYGHLAVVIALEAQKMTVVESNYHWDGIISTREISTSDSRIRGYLVINER